MTMTVKSGSLAEFFDSIKETARELDAGKAPSPKHTLWVDAEELAALLRPRRKALLAFLRNREETTLDELSAALHRSARSLRVDLALLTKYELIRVEQPDEPGRKVIRPTFARETLEFIARI